MDKAGAQLLVMLVGGDRGGGRVGLRCPVRGLSVRPIRMGA